MTGGVLPRSGVYYGTGGVDILAYTQVEAYCFFTKDLQSGASGNSIERGHIGSISQLCWSPDGRLLSCSADGTVKVWHYHLIGKTEERATARGDFGAALAAVFSADGNWVAAGYSDGRIRLWQLGLPPQRAIVWSCCQSVAFIGGERRLVSDRVTYDFSERLEAPAHTYTPEAVTALVVQTAGRRFAFSQGGLLRVWEQGSREQLRQWRAHDGPIVALASSFDGKALASASVDGVVKLWSWETGDLDRTLDPGVGPLHAVAWSRDGRQLAVTGVRGAVVWDLSGPSDPKLRFEHDLPYSAVAFGANVMAISGAQGTVELHDPGSGKLLHRLRGHKNGVRSLAFGPDGILLASGASGDSVRLWNALEGKQVAAFEQPSRGPLTASWLAFDPQGRYLAFNESQVWDLQSKTKVSGVETGLFDLCGQFLGDGSGVLLGTEFGAVRLCRLEEIDQKLKAVRGVGLAKPGSGSVDVLGLTIVVPGGHVSAVWGIAASKDGRWFATASHDHTVKLWDARSMKLVRTLTGHQEVVWGVAFSPDSQFLATGSVTERSGEICLWEVATGKEIHRFHGHPRLVTSLAFHPTQPLLASCSNDGSLYLWDLSNRKSLGLLHKLDPGVYSIAFRPDGRWLAVGCPDYRVALWKMEHAPATPAAPDKYLTGHTGAVWSVGFNADGTTLATGSERGVMILWNGETFEKMATLRGGVGQIRGISFSSDGQLLAGSAFDGPLIVWNLAALRRSLQEMSVGDWETAQLETRPPRQD
jgi:WD40 repeat protein